MGVEEDALRYHMYIEDDGPGIENKFHKKIFEILQTLKSRKKAKGSGMGLAIAEKIIRNNNGHIMVISEPSERRGARFEFSWPRFFDCED